MEISEIDTSHAFSANPWRQILSWGVPLLVMGCYALLAFQPRLRLAVPLVVGVAAVIVILLAVALYAGEQERADWSPAVVLTVAAILRLLFVFSPPDLSDDLYRYLWDGLLVLNGRNPYAASPMEIGPQSETARHLLEAMNHPSFVTIYPPAAQLIFAIGAWLGDGFRGLKILLAGMDLATCALLIRLLTSFGLPAGRAVLYAWHPLPVLEIGSSGHVDGAGVSFLLLTMVLLAEALNGRCTERGANGPPQTSSRRRQGSEKPWRNWIPASAHCRQLKSELGNVTQALHTFGPLLPRDLPPPVRHSRGSGNPGELALAAGLDSRFRGNDESRCGDAGGSNCMVSCHQPLKLTTMREGGNPGKRTIPRLSWEWRLHPLTRQYVLAFLAGLAFAGAVLVKLFPLLFLPGMLVLAGKRRRTAFVAGFLLGAAGKILPFVPGIWNMFVVLGTYVQNWEFSGLAFRSLRRMTSSGDSARLILGFVFLAAAAVLYGRLLRGNRTSIKRRTGCPSYDFHPDNRQGLAGADAFPTVMKVFCALTMAFLFLTPTLYPWYALYLVCLLPFTGDPAGLVLSWSVFLSYRVLIPHELLGRWIEDDWAPALIWLAPACVFLLVPVARRLMSRRARSGDPPLLR